MKKSFLIAGAAMLAMAVPAVAAMQGHGPGSMADMNRTDVEAKVKEHFAMFDADKDGAITRDEVKAHHDAMRASRMDERFKAMDKDGNGAISRAEFDAAHADRGPRGDRPMKDGMGSRPDGPPPAMADGRPDGARRSPGGMDHGKRDGRPGQGGDMMMGRMFAMADANKDGKVTLAEATGAALAHFDKVDANKDGKITAQERMDYRQSVRDGWKGKAARPDAKPAAAAN